MYEMLIGYPPFCSETPQGKISCHVIFSRKCASELFLKMMWVIIRGNTLMFMFLCRKTVQKYSEHGRLKSSNLIGQLAWSETQWTTLYNTM